jgi:CRISPR/Cas system CMR-associated protein Cmr5 small subunit
MKNLEQIRAAHAPGVAKETKKADVNKIPAMIMTNGLLAATAFANEEDGAKRPEMAAVMNGVARHLANDAHGMPVLKGVANAQQMLEKLTGADSADLRRATAEALAFVGYVKRFATKE